MLTLPDAIPLSVLILGAITALKGLAAGKGERSETERRLPASAITAIYVNEAVARELVEEVRGVHHQLERLNDRFNDLVAMMVSRKD